jgi:hypothetical protein
MEVHSPWQQVNEPLEFWILRGGDLAGEREELLDVGHLDFRRKGGGDAIEAVGLTLIADVAGIKEVRHRRSSLSGRTAVGVRCAVSCERPTAVGERDDQRERRREGAPLKVSGHPAVDWQPSRRLDEGLGVAAQLREQGSDIRGLRQNDNVLIRCAFGKWRWTATGLVPCLDVTPRPLHDVAAGVSSSDTRAHRTGFSEAGAQHVEQAGVAVRVAVVRRRGEQ